MKYIILNLKKIGKFGNIKFVSLSSHTVTFLAENPENCVVGLKIKDLSTFDFQNLSIAVNGNLSSLAQQNITQVNLVKISLR